MSPRLIAAAASWAAVMNLMLNPTVSRRRLCSAAVAISSASARFIANGFSHSTFAPAANARKATGLCVSGMVQMQTRSTRSRSRSSSYRPYALGTPNTVCARRSVASSASQIARTLTRSSRASAARWSVPLDPASDHRGVDHCLSRPDAAAEPDPAPLPRPSGLKREATRNTSSRSTRLPGPVEHRNSGSSS